MNYKLLFLTLTTLTSTTLLPTPEVGFWTDTLYDTRWFQDWAGWTKLYKITEGLKWMEIKPKDLGNWTYQTIIAVGNQRPSDSQRNSSDWTIQIKTRGDKYIKYWQGSGNARTIPLTFEVKSMCISMANSGYLQIDLYDKKTIIGPQTLTVYTDGTLP